ncbi:hypothetical protein FF38_05026 [Lucilia cuprina]|uniref:Uncharacterized protein n=1 Tax=Lucilia cuprina TaxID=7375 RepID=A0A0L0CJN0_LUCCU|nr:hypothetical protein FF38_05026 [Lucilia cuprina]
MIELKFKYCYIILKKFYFLYKRKSVIFVSAVYNVHHCQSIRLCPQGTTCRNFPMSFTKWEQKRYSVCVYHVFSCFTCMDFDSYITCLSRIHRCARIFKPFFDVKALFKVNNINFEETNKETKYSNPKKAKQFLCSIICIIVSSLTTKLTMLYLKAYQTMPIKVQN